MTTQYKKITRKEWIEALKSGDYTQATKRLHDEGAYCCLGVACSLAGVAVEDMEYHYESTDIDSVFGIQSLKLDIQSNFTHGESRQFDELAKLNDGGKTFEQIADLLIFDSWARGIE